MRLKLLSNVFLKDRYYLLEAAAAPVFKSAAPGQFLHIRIENSSDPLLRRPLSIHDVALNQKGEIESIRIIYEVVGKGTELLATKRRHDEVDALGPLGNGFDIERIQGARKLYLVAGGMGVAPLYFLAKRLSESRLPGDGQGRGMNGHRHKLIALIGARTKEKILCAQEFAKLGCEVIVATEDSSEGKEGLATDVLDDMLRESGPKDSLVCACGPKAMLDVVSQIANNHNIPAYISLEEFMGCGLGACLGCVIKTTTGYKRICHDGPVFDSREIVW